MLRYHGVLAGHSRDRAEVPAPPSRHPWTWLLRRVFAIDILTCPQCQSEMRVKSIATQANDILAILGMAMRARAPSTLGQLELDFAAA